MRKQRWSEFTNIWELKTESKRFVFLCHCLRFNRTSYQHSGCVPLLTVHIIRLQHLNKSAHQSVNKLSKYSSARKKEINATVSIFQPGWHHLGICDHHPSHRLQVWRQGDLITGIKSGRLDGGHAKSH